MSQDNGEEPIIASASASRETESVATVPCAICRRQFARYTCPRCNTPYCSLVCFRSEKHGECSESFYRKEIEQDVKSSPAASAEERRRMMDLLKRFEEDALEDSPLLGDEDDEDDGNDLHLRLQNIDLDSASYEDLWDALTPAEREKFLRALNDPSSELAQQLLASEQLEMVQIKPWWETSATALPGGAESTISSPRQHHGPKPPIMAVPDALLKQSSSAAVSGPMLLYNISALFVAYTYAIRHFAISPLSSLGPTDPEHAEICLSISRLVPFLTDKKSTTVHTSLSGVVTDLWSRFPSGHMDSQFFSLLLQDIAVLLRPATVTVVASTDSPRRLEDHPSANALRVLSDLASLFDDTSVKSKAKPNHVVHKLTFYAAYIIGTPAPMLRVLADEATMRAKTLEKEGSEGRRGVHGADVKRVHSLRQDAPRIEEL
ncbi:hypothetical protein C8Q76DRAFT_614104 [Earliella scabrosa]|nr:hypothetical protein C8Q76DRAFT_614104 [Earliella scabrosa]